MWELAYLRTHHDSKFWFLRYRDLDTGRWREQSTHLRKDDPKETRAAQRLAAKHTDAENKVRPEQRRGEWNEWVSDYIAAHYTNANTRRRAKEAWLRISEWLRLRALRHPRHIRYEHARDYLQWRTVDSDRPVRHNTALHEVKFVSFLIQEAIRREFAERNVFTHLGIGRAPVREKPELSDAQIAAARQAMRRPHLAGWMRIVFEIQLYTGCRFCEASIPMKQIDFKRSALTIEDAKRADTDSRKCFQVPLHPHLQATLEPLATQERTVAPLTREQNWRYNHVLKAATGATSHSLRVTFITRCHRAGLSEREAMRMVNHSTRLVHAVYSRLGADDLRPALSRIALPPPPD